MKDSYDILLLSAPLFGNIEEASYLAAASGHENKIPLPHNQSMEGDQGYTGVVVP